MLKTPTAKNQIGIRIPRELDEQLENHVKKIGISKPAFILNLIYESLSKTKDNNLVTATKT